MPMILYLLMPLIVSTAISYTVTMFAQTYLPAAAGNITLLTGVFGLLTIPAMVLLHRTDRRIARQEDGFWQRCSLLQKMGLLAAGFVLGVLCSLLEGWLMRISGVAAGAAYAPVGAFFQAKVWMQLLFLGIVTPVAEEMTFRGVLTERLLHYLSPMVTVLLGAALFAVGHGNMLQALYAFPMGVLLGLAKVYGGSLYLPVAIHMGANLISVLVGAPA